MKKCPISDSKCAVVDKKGIKVKGKGWKGGRVKGEGWKGNKKVYSLQVYG